MGIEPTTPWQLGQNIGKLKIILFQEYVENNFSQIKIYIN